MPHQEGTGVNLGHRGAVGGADDDREDERPARSALRRLGRGHDDIVAAGSGHIRFGGPRGEGQRLRSDDRSKGRQTDSECAHFWYTCPQHRFSLSRKDYCEFFGLLYSPNIQAWRCVRKPDFPQVCS